jgi:4-hydroxy-3-polyprenylbenzoate decarboxylase
MAYKDLRQWLEMVQEIGELKRLEGIDWNLDIGTMTEMIAKEEEDSPAILFDQIPGYPGGYRVLVGLFDTLKRSSITTNLPIHTDREGFVKAWRERLANPVFIPPKTVKTGPILENVYTGDSIDMFKFPVPLWHSMDGGRYIGTADAVFTRDPDEGWVNMGTYRVMIHGKDEIAIWISPGKHGRIHREKYFQNGKPCPVVACFGADPLFHFIASKQEPYGRPELEVVGGIRGEAVEILIGEETGLPIPAHAEIVVEGEILPDQKKIEGPFGEWTGYYASGEQMQPVVKVKRLYHRNDPIITGSPPFRPTRRSDTAQSLVRAAYIQDQMEKAGVPDVKAVACYQGRFLVAVAIKQRYPGHARQAGIIAAQCHTSAYLGRYVVVVDDDIDVTDFHDVLWAICTRTDPQKDLEVIRRCWSGPLDPIIPRGEKGFSSRAIIDATRPFEWMKDFPPVSGSTPAQKKQVIEKYGGQLGEAGFKIPSH